MTAVMTTGAAEVSTVSRMERPASETGLRPLGATTGRRTPRGRRRNHSSDAIVSLDARKVTENPPPQPCRKPRRFPEPAQQQQPQPPLTVMLQQQHGRSEGPPQNPTEKTHEADPHPDRRGGCRVRCDLVRAPARPEAGGGPPAHPHPAPPASVAPPGSARGNFGPGRPAAGGLSR